MRILRQLGVALVVALVAFGLVVVGARYHDGPVGVLAGGPLDSGAWAESEGVDWSFAADLPTLELQLLSPPRSRKVWLLVDEGSLFIPCGFVNVTLWKQWPYEAFMDGRAVIRLEGRRYPVELERVDDEAARERVLAGLAGKYGISLTEEGGAENVWIFRVDPRERGPHG